MAHRSLTSVHAAATAVFTLVVASLLVFAAIDLPDEPGGLTADVSAELDRSGVTNPVTAVLLNFRGYDTWLEVGVVLLAALGVLALRRSPDLASVPLLPPASPILAWLARLLVPLMVLSAGYLLWRGTQAPGGAFQAAAILAAAGVVLRLAGYRSVVTVSGLPLRAIVSLGFAAFLVAAVSTTASGAPMLQYPPAWAGFLVLLLEAAIALSIALTLAALFAGAAFATLTGRDQAPPVRPESE